MPLDRHPRAIIDRATGYVMGQRVIDALEEGGYILVSKPELTYEDQPPIPDEYLMDHLRYPDEPMRAYRLQMYVGGTIIDLRNRVNRHYMQRYGGNYREMLGREMFHKFAMELARKLGVPEEVT